jgi:hypothetical protein
MDVSAETRHGTLPSPVERLAKCHNSNTSFRPSLTRSIVRPVNEPTRFVSIFLSTVKTWETLTTEALERRESDLLMRMFPGAWANARFEVMTATRMVEILLSLKAFA